MNWLEIIFWVLTTVYYLAVIRIIFKILLENRNPLKTHAYLLLLVLLPIIGLSIYLLFGVDYRREKMFRRRMLEDDKLVRDWTATYLKEFRKHEGEFEYHFGSKVKIPRLLYSEEKAFVTENNEVEILINGEKKMPRLFNDIDQAKHHVHVEYYILEAEDEIGRRLLELLEKVSKRGVEVRMIYDGFGSMSFPSAWVERLQEAGIQLYPYLPVRPLRYADRMNFRDHRKIVIVDGRIGYLGGINIADRYVNDSPQKRFWRDTHMRVVGDSVKELQILFLLNWNFVSGLHLPAMRGYFPQVDVASYTPMTIMGSWPDSDGRSMMEAYFGLITSAESRLWITTPYLIPDQSITTALITAAKSGVDVKLMVPAEGDSRLAQAASESYFGELLRGGVRIFLYQKGVMHAKTITVDDMVCTVGSANMDQRSFEQNAEVNAFIYDQEVSSALAEQFKTDMEHCRELEIAEFLSASLPRRIFRSVARLLAPLL